MNRQIGKFEFGTNSIFLGSKRSFKHFDLEKNNVNYIVSVGTRFPQDTMVENWFIKERETFNINLYKYMYEFCEKVDEAMKTGNVIVHCYAGQSRSATMVISYFMWKKHWGLNTTIKFISKQKYVNPIGTLNDQLKRFGIENNVYEDIQPVEKANSRKAVMSMFGL
jgi:hypothetical protein